MTVDDFYLTLLFWPVISMPAYAIDNMVPSQEDINANTIMGIYSSQENRNILAPIYFNFTCK